VVKKSIKRGKKMHSQFIGEKVGEGKSFHFFLEVEGRGVISLKKEGGWGKKHLSW